MATAIEQPKVLNANKKAATCHETMVQITACVRFLGECLNAESRLC